MNLELLENQFGPLEKSEALGDWTLLVPREKSHSLLSFLRDTEGYQFDFLMDLCGVDYLGRQPRFEVVYHLYSLANNHRLRIRVALPEEDPVIDSAVNLWKTADWQEREVYDMLGIRFTGHPQLKRILLPETFEGYPLRKDYPMGKRQKIPVPVETP
ncbi:MAG: NADH-quinone oxidoreductase subunit C [Deltaproteobacteria bacterium]|nr:NADH-quinone oxidoreductase subunit C [Deltaproteobacteria bacterium]